MWLGYELFLFVFLARSFNYGSIFKRLKFIVSTDRWHSGVSCTLFRQFNIWRHWHWIILQTFHKFVSLIASTEFRGHLTIFRAKQLWSYMFFTQSSPNFRQLEIRRNVRGKLLTSQKLLLCCSRRKYKVWSVHLFDISTLALVFQWVVCLTSSFGNELGLALLVVVF